MSVFGAGVASMPTRASTGALFNDTPITDKWREQMGAAKQKLRDSYSGPGPYTVARVLADVDKWWKIASRYADEAPSLSTMPAARLKEAKDNALNLLEARAQLKLRKPEEIVEPAAGRVYLDAMTAPIDWLIAVGTPVVKDKEETNSTFKTALYVGLAVLGVYGLSKVLSSGAELTREMRSLRPAPAGMVHNPPAWAADPELWESARVAVEESGPYENAEAVKIHVYKQLGGRVS